MPPFDPQTATIAQIRQHLEGLASVDDALLDALDADARQGVRAMGLRERRRRKNAAAERARLEKMLLLEERLRARGARHIAGVDEAGRGPLAGPVVAAAVVLPEKPDLPGVNDSKALSPQRREALYEAIQDRARAWAVGQASVKPTARRCACQTNR